MMTANKSVFLIMSERGVHWLLAEAGGLWVLGCEDAPAPHLETQIPPLLWHEEVTQMTQADWDRLRRQDWHETP